MAGSAAGRYGVSQGDIQAFRGTPDTVRDYEGDLRTAYVGVDALAGRRWLFGAAVGRSGGRGTWQAGTTPGRLNTTLTTVYIRICVGEAETRRCGRWPAPAGEPRASRGPR